MIQVIQKAARVLQAVGEREGQTLSDLSRRLTLHKATLSTILATLVEVGYARKLADGTYAIGEGLVALARTELRRETLAGLAEAEARRLAASLGELVTVATLHAGDRLVLAKAAPDQSVTVDPRTEDRRTPYGSATGRVLLACAPPAEQAEVRATHGEPGGRWPAAAGAAAWQTALAEIAAAGLAEVLSADGEAIQVAVPVRGPDGRLWAAIGAGVPCYRFPPERREAVLAALRAAAERLSQALSLRWGSPEEGA